MFLSSQEFPFGMNSFFKILKGNLATYLAESVTLDVLAEGQVDQHKLAAHDCVLRLIPKGSSPPLVLSFTCDSNDCLFFLVGLDRLKQQDYYHKHVQVLSF